MLKVIQVGMNTTDLAGSLQLFSEAFGFRNAGAQGLWGDIIRGQGLPDDARALMWWMVGEQEFFQLEFFHHTKPPQRPLRADWQPSDLGWNRLGIRTAEFDHCLDAVSRHGVSPLGIAGTKPSRRAAYRDPYVGIIIEVIEDVPSNNTAVGPQVAYVTSSVSDLDAAKRFYRDTLGLKISEISTLHKPEDEALWSIGDAIREGFVATALGGGPDLEIVAYAEPIGRPRPVDYRTSDQGIVNIALGSRDREDIAIAFARLNEAGLRSPMIAGTGPVLAGYITNAERELEFASIPEEMDLCLGFTAIPFMGELLGKLQSS